MRLRLSDRWDSDNGLLGCLDLFRFEIAELLFANLVLLTT